MILGVDFDNTIVCYDSLFHLVAAEQNLIPSGLSANKSSVRDYLRNEGKESEWTKMQGVVYGLRMAEAIPFSGVKEQFINLLSARCIEDIYIISHKTKYPYLGEEYDLHEAAKQWLDQHGFFDKSQIDLSRAKVFFEQTKKAKLKRIEQCGCTHFVDDLPEILEAEDFPATVDRLLFDPGRRYSDSDRYTRVENWTAVATYLTG